MTQVETEPHTPIPIGNARLWNESMLGWWYDEKLGIAGFHRLAHLPNNDEAQIYSCILTHEGTRYRRCGNVSYAAHGKRSETDWHIEGLRFSYRDGWRIEYQSPECQVQLRFEDAHERVHASRIARMTAEMSGAASAHAADGMTKLERDVLYAGHVEGGCRVSGEVMLDGRRYAINGLGVRDHSWGGVRDLQTLRSTRWVIGTNGSDFSFCLTFASTPAGQMMRHGWIHRDGKLLPVKDFDALLHLDMDGLSWYRADVWFELFDGRRVEFTTDPTWDGVLVDSQRPPWMPYETMTTATVDGRRCVLNIEMANNPYGGGDFSRNPLRACAVDGLSRRPGT